MKMSNGFSVVASACRGAAYGHVPGHQYHDVEVGIGRRGSVYRAAVLETWGSCQGYDEEHGRRKVVARSTSWREALDGALSQARGAGIGTEEPVSEYLARAASACRDEAEEAEVKAAAEEATCVHCGLEARRQVLPDEGRDVSCAMDGCPRCGSHDVRA